MSIQDQLSEDLKVALKGGDEITKSTIRLIKAAVQNVEIEKGTTLDDTGVTEVLSRMVRQYRESITVYREHDRADTAAKEERELTVVMGYLPQQLGPDELLALAKQVAADVGASGPSDKGKVMGALMPQLRGKANGSLVNRLVGELLESLASS